MTETTVAVLLAQGEYPPEGLDEVKELADVRLAADAPALTRALERAQVVFAWDFRSRLLADAWSQARALRWIHAGSIGVDTILSDEVLDSDVVVTNTRGVFERPIAEYTLAAILMFAKDLRRTLDLQRERLWEHRETEVLSGRRVVILGAGGVARELAPLLRAVGMDVQVVGRRARPADGPLGRVLATSEVDRLLPSADFVVAALPLTAETRGYLDARRLGMLRRDARVINVGRGGLIDEDTLLRMLRDGRIAGAALDVFADEPLPMEHPFWTMDQVLVSPHMAGDRIGWERAVVGGFAENLRRWQAGRDLLNVIDKRLLHGADHPAARKGGGRP